MPTPRVERLDTAGQRRQRARIAANIRHVKHPAELMQAARDAFLERLIVAVDPTAALEPSDRERRGRHLRAAWLAAVAYQASRVRRRQDSRGLEIVPWLEKNGPPGAAAAYVAAGRNGATKRADPPASFDGSAQEDGRDGSAPTSKSS